MKSKLPTSFKLIIYTILTIGLFYILTIGIMQYMNKKKSFHETKLRSEYLAKGISGYCNEQCNIYYDIARCLKNTLEVTYKNIPRDAYKNHSQLVIKELLKQNIGILNVEHTWETTLFNSPVINDTKYTRHIFEKKQNNEIKTTRIQFTIPPDNQKEIFQKLLHEQANISRELPVYLNFDKISGIISIGIPLQYDQRYAGFLTLDISKDEIIKFGPNISFYNMHELFIIDNTGTIIESYNDTSVNMSNPSLIHSNAYAMNNLQKHEAFSFTSQANGKVGRYYYSLYPIRVLNKETPWFIGTKIPRVGFHNTFTDMNMLFIYFGIIGLFIIGLFWFLAFNRYIFAPLKKIKSTLTSIAEGDIKKAGQHRLMIKDNETGKIGQTIKGLVDNLSAAIEFAENIGKGNLDAHYEKQGQNDVLGASLLSMRENLRIAKSEEEKRKIEDKKRTWTTEGVALFDDILRQNHEHIEELSFSIIKNLVKYIKANQGGLFIIEEDENNNKYVELKSAYAYNRKKHLERKIGYEEGLIGKCILERNSVYLEEIPDDYVYISSGLGEEKPNSLVIVPLKINDDVFGVIELTSFNKIENHVISFIEKVGANIASTLSRIRANERTKKLLEESRYQAEELSAQEEEMRQNMEELKAAQEESSQKEEEMRSILNAMNASLMVGEYDMQGKVLNINDLFIEALDESIDNMIDQDIKKFNTGISQEDISNIWEELESKNLVNRTVVISRPDKDIWVNQTFAPILNSDGEPYKVLNIGIDITDAKKKEIEIQQHQETIGNLINEIPAKIFLKDSKGKMVLVNKAVADAHEESIEELIGKSDFDFFSDNKELAQKLWEEEQEIIKTGPKTFEQQEHVHNQNRYLRTTKIPFFIPYMNETGLLGFQFDITDFKEMETKLKNQFEELQHTHQELNKEKFLMDSLMENIPDSIYFKDRESKFLRASKNLAKLFDLDEPAELIGKSDFDFFSEEHAIQAYNDEQEIIKNEKPLIDFIEKETFEDGSVGWVSTSKLPLYNEKHEVIGTFGISRNVTEVINKEIEAKKLTEEMKKQKADLTWEIIMFNVLMDHIPGEISFKTKKGIYQRVNTNKAKELGFKHPEEIIGKTDHDILNKTSADKIIKEDIELMENNQSVLNSEEKHVQPDGLYLWKSISKIPFTNQKGEVIGIFQKVSDITINEQYKAQLINYKSILSDISGKLPILTYVIDNKGIITSIEGKGLLLLNKRAEETTGKFFTEIIPRAKQTLSKKIKTSVKFRTKGKHKNYSWEMEHVIFPDHTREGGLIGYAFETIG